MSDNGSIPPLPLAYVEYFREDGHDWALNMFKYKRARNTQGHRIAAIVPLDSITQAVQLVPRFKDKEKPPGHLNSNNVMEEWDSFILNRFTDDYSYQTLY